MAGLPSALACVKMKSVMKLVFVVLSVTDRADLKVLLPSACTLNLRSMSTKGLEASSKLRRSIFSWAA
jgi:hypothetical protein